VATGTPLFSRAHVPCEMCADIPCVVAARPVRWIMPSRNRSARYGSRCIVDQETLFSTIRIGAADVCYRVCPGDRQGHNAGVAPTIRQRPPCAVHCHCGIPRIAPAAVNANKSCAGMNPPSMVIPMKLARASWASLPAGLEEKAKAGGALMPDVLGAAGPAPSRCHEGLCQARKGAAQGAGGARMSGPAAASRGATRPALLFLLGPWLGIWIVKATSFPA